RLSRTALCIGECDDRHFSHLVLARFRSAQLCPTRGFLNRTLQNMVNEMETFGPQKLTGGRIFH
ncbi:hypothetical protein, partial [Sinorhizobium meliloti]|uniref:hypothetical protein n=1 Tax=Rhizobium meliloti TaxID=382 RepID=UPI001AED03DA